MHLLIKCGTCSDFTQVECFCAKLLQSCLTLFDPMDCSSPGPSVHGILQARILEWVAMPSSRGSSQPRDWTQVSHTAGKFFTIWTTSNIWYLASFHMLMGYSSILSGEMSIQVLYSLTGLPIFLLLMCRRSFSILDINPLWNIWLFGLNIWFSPIL